MIKLEMTYCGVEVCISCSHNQPRDGYYINNSDFLIQLQKFLDTMVLYDDIEVNISKRDPVSGEPDNFITNSDPCPAYSTVTVK